MKILYLSPAGKKIDLINIDEENVEADKVYDMDPIRNSILTGIQSEFKDVEIVEIKDILKPSQNITSNGLEEFDLVLCDLTTCNPNVLYLVGRSDALNIPVVYIKSNTSIYPLILEHKRILLYSNESIDHEFQDELQKLIRLAMEKPLQLLESIQKNRQPKAFISYSHQDKTYLNRLMVHLKPLTRKGLLDVWVDTKIKIGDEWEEKIKISLDNATIAILLISADFMASDFIVDNELPPLLSKAEVKGTRILPVILSPCRFSRDKTLNRFQAANSPDKPLSSMSHDEREAIYDRLMIDIEKSLEIA